MYNKTETILREAFYAHYINQDFPSKEQATQWAVMALSVLGDKEAILNAMEEYGKQQYNQAIDDAAKRAKTFVDKGKILELKKP